MADPFGGTDLGTVTVIVNSTNSTTQRVVAIEAVPGPGVKLTFSGVPGQTYIIQATTNVVDPDWIPISTNEADAYGLFIITDSEATGYPYRYYRSVTE